MASVDIGKYGSVIEMRGLVREWCFVALNALSGIATYLGAVSGGRGTYGAIKPWNRSKSWLEWNSVL